ncbi:XRE family transcriptional regulator [Candidatus Woesearchaeota archaeon CG10_big_fil_rev_8_21_14_0_10_45_16]|nr:MAG: XRE family transcriptional regulator [Candidatus Woesearchaeota archaeon CG10_big_fil_rev_8_21_14_0_10_45_16]
MRSLEEIKRLRKQYHLNQKELADKAGVSQSLIAKIESGKVDPTYTKARQIFEALEELREKAEIKASQLMHKKVVFIESKDSLKEAIMTMRKRSISQMPVLSKGKVAGLLTENLILQQIVENNDVDIPVGEIMDDAPPIVSPKTGFKSISELLTHSPVVLVSEKGEIQGIISKADLLGKIE